MSEINVKSKGAERWKYLDMANISFATREYESAEGFIRGFLTLIDGESGSGKEITSEFNRIDESRKESINKLKDDMSKLGYLEQHDLQENKKLSVEVDALHERLAACWIISQKNSLFNL